MRKKILAAIDEVGDDLDRDYSEVHALLLEARRSLLRDIEDRITEFRSTLRHQVRLGDRTTHFYPLAHSFLVLRSHAISR